MTALARKLCCAALAVCALMACSDVTFEGGGPLTLSLSADRGAVGTGQDVTFSYEAKGSILIGLILDYGDGEADSLDMAGAQTASGRFVHAFGAPGTYTVVGTLLDNMQGPTTAEVVVTVSASH